MCCYARYTLKHCLLWIISPILRKCKVFCYLSRSTFAKIRHIKALKVLVYLNYVTDLNTGSSIEVWRHVWRSILQIIASQNVKRQWFSGVISCHKNVISGWSFWLMSRLLFAASLLCRLRYIIEAGLIWFLCVMYYK